MYLSNNQKVSQIFGGSESSWENNGVEVILLQRRQSLHFTSCYSRRFHQNVPVIDMILYFRYILVSNRYVTDS